MKYLEHMGLENLSNLLDHAELGGGLALHGRVEIYSTKRSTEEKKLAKQLESKLSPDIRCPSDGTPKGTSSPEKSKPHLNLVQTLNAAQLDHDFSQLTPESFISTELSEVVHAINGHLAELTVRSPAFLSDFWKEVNGAMDGSLSSCEVYRLADTSIVDDLEDGVVWSLLCFFCSKELKRICYLHLSASSKFRSPAEHMDSDAEDDDMDVDGSSDGSKSSDEESEENGY